MFSDTVKELIYEAQNGYCHRCTEQIHSVHHKLHDIKHNREKFPNFIDSPFNAVGLCFKCHKDFSHLYRISENMAEVFENWLVDLKYEES